MAFPFTLKYKAKFHRQFAKDELVIVFKKAEELLRQRKIEEIYSSESKLEIKRNGMRFGSRSELMLGIKKGVININIEEECLSITYQIRRSSGIGMALGFGVLTSFLAKDIWTGVIPFCCFFLVPSVIDFFRQSDFFNEILVAIKKEFPCDIT